MLLIFFLSLTTLVSSQLRKLSEIFKDLDLHLDIELLENYLTCMEFCNVIEDEEVLNLIIGDEMTDGREKVLLFPGSH